MVKKNNNKKSSGKSKHKKAQTLSYEEERELRSQKTGKIIAWGLLIIMGLTVISWSMLGNPTGSFNSDSTTNISFTQNLYQNPSTGESFDGARINGIDFIFYQDVTQFAEDNELIDISNRLSTINSSIIYEYTDPSFQNDDARFLINQGLRANEYFTSPINNSQCIEPTLVYTTLNSNITYNDNCIVFNSNVTQTFSLANGITYHLIKDLS